MPMTSSRARTSAALLLALMLPVSLAFADQKDDLYAKGVAAVNAGEPVGAAAAFCALPADFKDAAQQCTTYKPIAERAAFRYKQNYADGQSALQAGDFATAEAKFKNVKGGDFYSQAQQRLAEIPSLKAKAQEAANAGQAVESANKTKLDQGTAAFNSGNMDAAEAALNGVTGSHQAEANAVLQKVRAYKAAVAKGQAFEGAKDFQAAKNAYVEAVNINPSGPATAMLARATAAMSSPAPNNPPPITTATATVKPPQPKPQIDVAAYLDQARKSLAKNQFAKARNFVEDVLRQERGNQEAADLLTQINAGDPTVAQAGGADKTLAGIIQSFYQDVSVNNFTDTEDQLKFYLFSKGKSGKAGLANFYLGASLLSRFYLTGGTDQNLKRDALSKFKTAKGVDGFTPPEKFISPKIMKAFQEAS